MEILKFRGTMHRKGEYPFTIIPNEGVELHGGTVEACSAGLGQGSEFTIRLPALPVESPNDTAQLAPPQTVSLAAASHRVLVVDDVADSAESLAELIALWGHQVRAAHDGPSALQSAREFHPEVVLLDIGMPGMDGYEVALRLRAEYRREGLLLVAMTGYGQLLDREATRVAGFDYHLIKPVDLTALKELLEVTLQWVKPLSPYLFQFS